MRRRGAIIVTVFIISLFGSVVGFRQAPIEPQLVPSVAIGWFVLFIGWAIVIGWRTVAGALVGLLAWTLTPPLGPPDIGQAVICVAIGAMLGFVSEEVGRDATKPPNQPNSPPALPSA